jgi:tetratricopeptide (TPR) repeat protein
MLSPYYCTKYYIYLLYKTAKNSIFITSFNTMKTLFSRLFFLTLAVYVFASCTGDPLVKPIKDGIDAQNYEAAIVAADSALLTDPTNAMALYYRGYALNMKAGATDDIAAREAMYREMRSNLVDARAAFAAMEKAPAESEQVTNLILNAWGREHNEAIAYALDDSVMATVQNPLDYSIQHLVNATSANPDSTLSYDVLAQVYYMNSDYEGAATAMARVIELKNPGEASEYDRLASYNFLMGKPDVAVNALEEGLALYPDSTSLIQKMADGLFQTGDTDRALELVEGLVENDPTNAQYRLVIGTQIYQRVMTLSDSVSANSDMIYEIRDEDEARVNELNAINEELREQIDMLTKRAEEALVAAAEIEPNNPMIFNTLGVVYQNKAAALFDLRNNTVDNDEAMSLDELAKAEATLAMENYERAAELDPENPSYWESLFRIYTSLGMLEEAEAAMEKAGM